MCCASLALFWLQLTLRGKKQFRSHEFRCICCLPGTAVLFSHVKSTCLEANLTEYTFARRQVQSVTFSVTCFKCFGGKCAFPEPGFLIAIIVELFKNIDDVKQRWALYK